MAAALWAPLAQAQAGGVVRVSFRTPERFTDFGTDAAQTESHAAQLKALLSAAAVRHLRAGQTLELEVLDVDLAGRVEPRPGSGSELRIVDGHRRGTRIQLRYVLRGGIDPAVAGTEWIEDDGLGSMSGRADAETMGAERRMLDRWMEQRIGRAPKRL